MFAKLFRALIERVRALFLTDAALDLEAELVSRQAERQAELLRQADRYDEEGLHGIADHIRKQTETLSTQRPLAGVLPAIDHLDAAPSSNGPALPDRNGEREAKRKKTPRRLAAKPQGGPS